MNLYNINYITLVISRMQNDDSIFIDLNVDPDAIDDTVGQKYNLEHNSSNYEARWLEEIRLAREIDLTLDHGFMGYNTRSKSKMRFKNNSNSDNDVNHKNDKKSESEIKSKDNKKQGDAKRRKRTDYVVNKSKNNIDLKRIRVRPLSKPTLEKNPKS